MNAIIQKRGTGKAKQLMKAAREVGQSAILTKDKRAFEVKAKNYGFTDLAIYDYEDLETDNIPLDTKLFVHNGDQFMEYLLDRYYGLTIAGYTATME